MVSYRKTIILAAHNTILTLLNNLQKDIYQVYFLEGWG